MDLNLTPPRNRAIFKKEIKRNKKETKRETPCAPTVLIFRKFLSYIQKRNNWKNRDKAETYWGCWGFTLFAESIISNYIIWYKTESIRLRKTIFKKEITPQHQTYQAFRCFIKRNTKTRDFETTRVSRFFEFEGISFFNIKRNKIT